MGMGGSFEAQEHMRVGLGNVLQSREKRINDGVWYKTVEGLSRESYLLKNCGLQIPYHLFLCLRVLM